jgi:hypothetical protein
MKGARAPYVAVIVSATAPAITYQILRSSRATCAFRGAETGAKRFGAKTSCVPVSVSALLQFIDTSNTVGPREQTILAVLIFTAAGIGAVARLTMKSLKYDGTQCALRFSGKGGKAREIPVWHDVEQILLRHIERCGNQRRPLFRTAIGSVRHGIRALQSCLF